MSRGTPSGAIRIAAAMAFVAAAFSSMAQRHEKQQAVLKSGGYLPNDPTNGTFNYRGRGGNLAFRRAAQKRRNVLRHRKACRG